MANKAVEFGPMLASFLASCVKPEANQAWRLFRSPGKPKEMLKKLAGPKSLELDAPPDAFSQRLALRQTQVGPTPPTADKILRSQWRVKLFGAIWFRKLAFNGKWASLLIVERDIQVRWGRWEAVWKLSFKLQGTVIDLESKGHS